MSHPVAISDYIHQDEFPARLRHAAERCGSISALARAIGRSEGAVRKWIRGASEPNVSDLRSICRASGIPIGWLAAGEPPAPDAPDQVRDAVVPYNSFPASAPNEELLESVLEALGEEARERGTTLTPAKQSAAAIALYGLSRAAGRVDPGAAARLVKLAL